MIRDLIRKNADLTEANEKLLEFIGEIKRYENEVIHNASWLSKKEKESRKRVISNEEEELTQMRIQAAQLDLLRRMEKQIEKYFPGDSNLRRNQDLTIPQILNQKLKDRYVILRELFSGASASFYVGYEVGSERKVVFRVLKNDSYRKVKPNDDRYENLNILLNLKHRNIVRIFGNNLTSYPQYQILEYINGVSCDHLVDKSIPFTLHSAINLIIQLADALYYLHINDIKHGNIKPDKVLIDNELKPVISVFELANAKTVDYSSPISMEKLLYTAPELLKGDIVNPNSKSDQFSMGLLAYEILSGVPLFATEKTENEKRDVQGVFEKRIQFFKTKKQRAAIFDKLDLPSKLEKIILRMLEEIPENRFKSMAGVKKALESIKVPIDEQVEILTDSFHRCTIRNPDFTKNFYQRLFTETEEGKQIKNQFFQFEEMLDHEHQKNIEISPKEIKKTQSRIVRRYKMLRVAIDLLIWSGKEPDLLKQIDNMPIHHNVTLSQYRLFIKTLVKMVKEHDYLWDVYDYEQENYPVKEAWEKLSENCLNLLSDPTP